ncbi:MAG TPA: methyltransferase [Erythrobacter sp.]|nr:methyltransferase [Erythrobacter sp.]
MRWIAWRNRVLANPRFQDWAARNWLTRRVARRKARELFDLVAGFTYTQVLLAMVQSGLLERLGQGPGTLAELAATTGLSEAAALRLVKASESLDLVEEATPGIWMLGQRGAALLSQEGAKAMIRHHPLLYRDLADPLALLRQDRAVPTALSEFWRYAAREQAATEASDSVTPYSLLMAASQAMVAREVLRALPLERYKALLDVGGGHGAFVAHVAEQLPRLRLAVFDLPGVVEGAAARLAALGLEEQVALHGGDFFRDSLPQGFDCISLVRILHDHDDGPAQRLLDAIRIALPPGGALLIAEPMAGTRGAEAMGEAYFGMYLWAMRSGRPRRSDEIGAMLGKAGFSRWREFPTAQPLIARVIVAFA